MDSAAQNNLLPETFESEAVNIFCIFDQHKDLVFGMLRDSENNTLSPLDRETLNFLDMKGLILDRSKEVKTLHGVILHNGKPMIIASRGIFKTDLKGPMNGCFILGRYLDKDYVELLSKQTRVDLSIIVVKNPSGLNTTKGRAISKSPMVS